MKTQMIGDIAIDRVVENEGPFLEVTDLLPDAPEDLVAENADWLAPRFVERATGKAIMSFHSLLLRTGRHTILVDACVGNHKHRPLRPNWHEQTFPWLDNLRAHGVAPEAVDFVMCTHLHADHVGWNTQMTDGRWVPTFPNAKYVFAKREYDYWEAEHNADATMNHGSFGDSVLPVMDAGQAVLVGDDHAIEDGIWLEPAPGHTPGNIVVRLERNGDRAVLVGDVCHTAAQFAMPSLSSKFCSDPVKSAETRTRLIESVADTDTLFLTAHFPTPTAGRIVGKGDAFRFADV